MGFEFIDKNITEDEIELVKAVNSQVDVLIAGVHWGAEYKDIASSKQREIAKVLVKSGADVISGHHPHWVQDIEYLDSPDTGSGKVPVYYSLGNFVFDQMWSEETKKGLVVRLTFDGQGKITKEDKLPIYMKDWAQPEFVEN